MKSMDDLPDIPAENRFAFSADLAEIVVFTSLKWHHDPATCPICNPGECGEWTY
jgi:hypothetical protein